MARTREFDPAIALDAAMRVFWRNGYYATSIEDLVEGTGVSRYGLYSIYENKRGLFQASLDFYTATILKDLTVKLQEEHASLPAIEEFVSNLGNLSAMPAGRVGCLLWNSASEVAPHDKATARKVSDFRNFLRKCFETALRNAIAKGEVNPGFPVAAQSDFLAGAVQTLAVFARSRAEPHVIANFVRISLSTLR